MRTLSSSLLTAATRWGSKPTILADVKNKRWRWTTLCSVDSAACFSAQVQAPWSYAHPTPTLVYRISTDESGYVRLIKVTNIAYSAQWYNWGVATFTGAIPSSDCALALLDSESDQSFRAFWLVNNGGTTEIWWSYTSDQGATWAAPALICTTDSSYLAACEEMLFYFNAGALCVRHCGAAYTTWHLHAGPTFSCTTPRGVGVLYDYHQLYYRIAIAADGKIYVATHHRNADTWPQHPTQIAPGGRGPAPAASLLREPSVASYWHGTDLRYAVSWIEDYSGTDLTWVYPVIVWSLDYAHFGDETAISMGATTHHRANLTYWHPTKTLYIANEESVAKSVCWATANADLNVSDLTVESYERDTRPLGSRLTINLVNPNPPSLRAPVRNNLTNAAAIDGIYDAAGRTGSYACLYPLSVLFLNRGYITGGYAERETLDPYYLTEIEVTKGQGSGPHAASSLVLHAVDGWGLLDLWRPAETLTWVNQTIEWLCTELCQRVGLAFTHGASSAFTRALPLFTVSPMSTAATAIQQLLFLAGAVAYFTEAGAMHAVNLFGYAPTARVYLGNSNEILTASLALRPYVATASRVWGNATGANAENDIQSMTLGLRLKRYIEDARLSVTAQANDVADYLWRTQELSERSERVTVPMRPDPELYDTVSLHVAIGVIPRADDLRQIIAIRERYDASQQIAQTTLEMRRA